MKEPFEFRRLIFRIKRLCPKGTVLEWEQVGEGWYTSDELDRFPAEHPNEQLVMATDGKETIRRRKS